MPGEGKILPQKGTKSTKGTILSIMCLFVAKNFEPFVDESLR
jgi:hypothetical protein